MNKSGWYHKKQINFLLNFRIQRIRSIFNGMTPLFIQYQGKRNVLHKNPYDIDNIACFIDMHYSS